MRATRVRWLALCLLAGAAAHADELQTVVVTAQRRVESLQKTPISLEVLDSKKLENLGILGMADLNGNVPAMTVETFPTNNAELRLFIRGIGVNDAQITQDPSVAVYLDGIYIARSAGLALDIADLARVEVLRGPQGTLYGRNATGGAVNLVTKRPGSRFSVASTLSYSSYDRPTAKAFVNLPLGDDLAAKLALLGRWSGGYVENASGGSDFGDRIDRGLRFETRWQPSESLAAQYAFDTSDMKDYNYMTQAVLPPRGNHGQAEIFKAYAQANTVYSDQRLDRLASFPPLAQSRTRVDGHGLVLTGGLDPFELKYIGSYRTLHDATYSDLGGGLGSATYRLDTGAYAGPAATMGYGGPTPLQIPLVFQKQWTHELQLSGDGLLDHTLQFIVGAYAFREIGGEDGRPYHHILNTKLDPSQTAPFFASFPGLDATLANLASPNLVVFWNYLYQIDNAAEALFAQSTWSPAWMDRRLHVTVGLRGSWDQRRAIKDRVTDEYVEGTLNGQGTAVKLPPQQGDDVFNNVRATNSYKNFSPSFNLQYDLNQRATLYASSSAAYKSGGFNVRDPQVSAASGPASDGTNYGFGFVEGFRPEHVHSYELGTKSEWFGRSLRTNADLFYTQYRDMQVNFLIPGTVSDSKTRNAGRALIRGFELDTTWQPVAGLVLAENYSFLDAKTLSVIDFNGNNVAARYPFVSAARNSFNSSVDWTMARYGWGSLRGYLNFAYLTARRGQPSVPDYRDGTRIPAYGLLAARFGADGIRLGAAGTLDLNLWAHNLLDRKYPLIAIDNTPQADRAVVWGQPRTIGLDLVYRYD